jgi:hypothetical protein
MYCFLRKRNAIILIVLILIFLVGGKLVKNES